MLTPAEFGVLLSATGIDTTWHQAKAPNTVAPVKAIVAPIDRRSDPLVNSYGVNGVSIQVAATDCVPAKFDRFHVGSERYTVDTPVPMHERGSGRIVYYICYVKGR